MPETLEVLVPGGEASPGPPLGPAIGPLGVNIMEVVELVNEKTKSFNGMQVPVKITIGDDKSIDITVGTPPTSALIMQEAGLEKGSGEAGKHYVGDISIKQIIKIAGMKKGSMLSLSLKNTVKEILGTCSSMGIKVDGKKPQEVQSEIDEGNYDGILKGKEWT